MWLYAVCVAVWVCVNVCSISAQAFETGVFMFELRSRNSLCVAVCCVGVCVCFISAQTFKTGVFMFELSWSKACQHRDERNNGWIYLSITSKVCFRNKVSLVQSITPISKFENKASESK